MTSTILFINNTDGPLTALHGTVGSDNVPWPAQYNPVVASLSSVVLPLQGVEGIDTDLPIFFAAKDESNFTAQYVPPISYDASGAQLQIIAGTVDGVTVLQ